MEKDPNYKNKEERLGNLKYLEELPSEKLSNYIFQHTTRTNFY